MPKYIITQDGQKVFSSNVGATFLYDSSLSDINELRLPISINQDLSLDVTQLDGKKVTLQLAKS